MTKRFGLVLPRVVAAMLVAVPLAARQLADDPAGVAPFTPDHVRRHDKLMIGARAVDLTLIVPDAASPETEKLWAATASALQRLDDWLGPLPSAALTVIDAPWHIGVSGASYPGVVVTSIRWLSTSRDPWFERPLLAALARQYTLAIASSGDEQAPFAEGLALYLGTRLIHDQLEGRNFETPRYFGGFIPFSLRSVLNSTAPGDPRPRPRHLADVEQPADARWRAASAAHGTPAQRIAVAFHAFERHVGWPAFQQVLERFMDRFRGRAATATDFVTVASETIGPEVSWFFDQAFRGDVAFDYAVTELRSDADSDGFTTSVMVHRMAAGIFAAGLPLLIRFDDGSEISEMVDGRTNEQAFRYRGPARAVLAGIDPDATLLIDADRENNTRTIGGTTNRLGVRLALNWMMWLQDAMLAYTALL